MKALIFNPGSSTLKFALFGVDNGVASVVVRGAVEHIGAAKAALHLEGQAEGQAAQSVGAANPAQAAAHILGLQELGGAVDAVGCRVVHGGAKFTEATRITPDVLTEIRALAPLAPLHNPVAAALIEAVQKALPDAPVFAVFDTAFHHTLPPIARAYALPRDLSARHDLRRCGFHGISHQYVSGKLLECMKRDAPGTRLITCHLGNGASVCAVRDGASVDTSMGLTPLEGLVMGTRSGDVDPGLVLYLLRELKMSADDVDDLLNHKSGLLGVSGLSADTRELEAAAMQKGDAQAELALEIFAYRVRKYIGAYAAALGGVDAIAFTGGIGEHSAGIRMRVCRDMEFLGLQLNEERNNQATGGATVRISDADAPVQIWVIPADEEGQIAREIVPILPAA